MAVLQAQGKTFPTQTQVLVIGGGACGTIAALAAKEHGAEAFIVERDAKPSGSTSLSSGQIPAAGTKLQRAAGLLDAVEREEIPLATSARAADLYADADGRIRGVRVTRPDGKTEDIGCEALILACNGYGGSKEMLKRFIPEAAELFYEGHVGNQGDAVRWGEELGASLKDMGSFQGHGAMATPHGVHLNWATVTEGGFHANAHGKRFSNENAGYSEQALKVHRQPGSVAWAIWDERS